MITSDRRFGIEIEFTNARASDYLKLCKKIRVVPDGSIRDWARSGIGGEYVSPILQGLRGEQEIYSVCEILKLNGASGDDPALSVHVHLDGRKNEAIVERSSVRPQEIATGERVYAFSKKLLPLIKIKDSILADIYRTGVMPAGNFRRTDIDGISYFSMGDVTRHPKINYRYYVIKPVDRFNWLKKMFYFYTLYSPVLQCMVSPSRRRGNMYCIPLPDSWDAKEIFNLKSMDSLISCWYKGGGVGGKFDDSRYHEFNLHSFFYNHGTVEIRSHGGTIDAYKILMWTKLHQYIADKLETLDIKDIEVTEGDEKFVSFLRFFDGEEVLEEYIKRLLGYFSGINIKNGKVIRKK